MAVNRPNFQQRDGFTFSFKMTDHLNPQFSEDDSLKAICKKISSYHKSKFPKWTRLKADFRIIKIAPTSELFKYLDSSSQNKSHNWLIFCRVGNQITVTHFGPFGKNKEKQFDHQVNKTRLSLQKLKSKWLQVCSSSQPTKQEEARLKAIHSKILSGFWRSIEAIEEQIEGQKSELEEVTGNVFSSDESREHVRTEMQKITIKTGCVLVRQILTALRKKIGVEVAKKLTVKVAVKEVTKETVKGASKSTAKTIAKAVPFVGLGVGVGFAIWRLANDDVTGAGLEIASGAASCVPGAGTAASLAIDAGLVVKDVINAKEKIQSLTTDTERIERELNRLFEECEKDKEEYDFITEVLGDAGYDFEKLKHDIELVDELR